MIEKKYFFDKKTLKGLLDMDKWLSQSPWNQKNMGEVDLKTAHMVRELITRIEDKGYYTEDERDILNGVREHWFRSKYGGQWVCSYCLKSTKDVDIDYLSGTDHLQCVLREEHNELKKALDYEIRTKAISS